MKNSLIVLLIAGIFGATIALTPVLDRYSKPEEGIQEVGGDTIPRSYSKNLIYYPEEQLIRENPNETNI